MAISLTDLTGTNSASEMYDNLLVHTGLAPKNEQLPVGERGVNLSKLMRRVGMAEMNQSPSVVEEGDGGYGVMSIPNWTEGWAQYVEREYGHRNAFLAMSMYSGSYEELQKDFAEDSMEHADHVLGKVATKLAGNDDRNVTDPRTGKAMKDLKPERKTPIQGDIGTDPQGIVGATPVLIDPDLVNTVRSAAPVLDVVDVVAQAGFTASYNIVSSREEPAFGWSTEEEVRDMTSSTGSAFTISNDDKDMKIWADLVDVSDFASRAMSSLDFMDLEGTSIEVRTQEYATEEAETVLYGEPSAGATDGSAKDSQAPEGLYAQADNANTSYTVDRSSYTISGDKPLFSDIKSYLLGLVKNTAANLNNLIMVTSLDMFNALEDEANVNVRLDTFDGTINYGREPSMNTLSIHNVPILPDPNVRNHSGFGGSGYNGNIGDVFIFERNNFQRRALQPFSSTALGQRGLADLMAMFQYETLVDKTQGEHVRVLENYSIDAVSDT